MKPRTLKRARKTLGLTQLQLAQEIGYARNAVERWERGVYPIPMLVARHLTQKVGQKIGANR